MIPTLYPCFRHWSEKGSVYLISDTHFDDNDCLIMDKHWITPNEHITKIAQKIHKNDTLIHLGDVGNVNYFKNAWKPGKRPHMVLIMGNHDESAERFQEVFDEIYTGPLMIAEKLLLSHEPIANCPWCYNIHGHNHDKNDKNDNYHLNLASNVVDFNITNLQDIIKSGVLKSVKSLHRSTIDKATKQKRKKESR